MTIQPGADAERARRGEDVDRIRHSTRLAGGVISAAAQADQDAFVAGTVDEPVLLQRLRSRYRFSPAADDTGGSPGARRPWESDPAHRWWPGYLDTKWWGVGVGAFVLRNRGGATTPEELAVRQGDTVAVGALTLRLHAIPGTYDLAGLRAIHTHLFGQVYEWAGRVRTHNAAQGPPFAPPAQIGGLMAQVAAHVQRTGRLARAVGADYPEQLARIYHVLTMCHPFPAGNGLTQREFVTALARETAHRVDWSRATRVRHGFAAIRARRDKDLAPLIELFQDMVEAGAADGSTGGA